MIDFGLTSYGFRRKRLSEIKLEKEAAFKSIFGDNIDLVPSSNFGQIIGIESENEAILWELLEHVYNSFYPSTAQGVSLSNLVTLNGITRKGETRTKVTLALGGTNGTVIPAGSLVSIPDNSEQFSTDSYVTLNDSYVSVEATAINPGPIVAGPYSISKIDTPIFGWQVVGNPFDALPGRDVETDKELRIRRALSTQTMGSNLTDSLFGKLSNIENVRYARVISNGANITSVEGIPPHNFLCIVLGGSNINIAEAIWQNTPQGIMSYGDITESITDSQGFIQSVKFSRPILRPIYFKITIIKGDGYPSTGHDDIISSIVEFGKQNYGIGKEIASSQFYIPINSVPGIISVELSLGFSPNPTLEDNLTLAYNEVGDYQSNFIEVI